MHGIHTIDTGFARPSFDAAYLVAERGRLFGVGAQYAHGEAAADFGGH